MGGKIFNVLTTIAEFEGDLICMRIRECMAVAQVRGRLRGKQPNLSDRQLQQELCRMHVSGESTITDPSVIFSICMPTVYRTLRRIAA